MLSLVDLLNGKSASHTEVARAARARRLGLNATQAEVAERSGVPLSTLKRFEKTGEIGLPALIKIATALECGGGFVSLFPPAEPRTLDDLNRSRRPRQRASKGRAR